jgi:integrase
MNGYIQERIRKKGTDKNGKMKENLVVYDVYYRYKNPATGQWKKTSKKGFTAKKDAEKYLVTIQHQMLENTFVLPKKLTLREYLNDWLETYVKVNLRKTTIDGYKRIIEKHLLPNLGNIELQNLNSNHIDNFYAQKQKSGKLDGTGGLAPRTLMYIHRVLNQAIEHAVKKKIISRNAVKDITNKPKLKKFKNEIYSSTELVELLNAVKSTYMEAAITLGGIHGEIMKKQFTNEIITGKQ